MSRWFRFYDGALDDPKVQGLTPILFKFWVNLLCVASKNDGNIPEKDLSFLMRLDPRYVEENLHDLRVAGLIDVTDNGMEPHNWPIRQFKSDVSNDRVKRHRERHRNGTCNVTKTPQETPPETETETEEKKERRKAPRRLSYPPMFQKFWGGYPTDPLMSKSEALTEWQNITPEDQEAAIAALPAFRAATAKLGPEHRVIHACRYLKKRRFDGFTAQVERLQAVIQSPRHKVDYDSDEWRAWAVHYKAKGVYMPNPVNGSYYFPSQWPPGHVQRETSEEAA